MIFNILSNSTLEWRMTFDNQFIIWVIYQTVSWIRRDTASEWAEEQKLYLVTLTSSRRSDIDDPTNEPSTGLWHRWRDEAAPTAKTAKETQETREKSHKSPNISEKSFSRVGNTVWIRWILLFRSRISVKAVDCCWTRCDCYCDLNLLIWFKLSWTFSLFFEQLD